MSARRSLIKPISIDFGALVKYLVEFSGVAITYLAVAKLSLALASVHPSASPIWPPTGFALRGAKLLRKAPMNLQLNEHIEELGEIVFCHACKLGFEGIVLKRLGSPYISGRSCDWLKFKNPAAPAVKREAEEDWGR
jgi:hypothetical protein